MEPETGRAKARKSTAERTSSEGRSRREGHTRHAHTAGCGEVRRGVRSVIAGRHPGCIACMLTDPSLAPVHCRSFATAEHLSSHASPERVCDADAFVMYGGEDIWYQHSQAQQSSVTPRGQASTPSHRNTLQASTRSGRGARRAPCPTHSTHMLPSMSSGCEARHKRVPKYSSTGVGGRAKRKHESLTAARTSSDQRSCRGGHSHDSSLPLAGR